MKIILLANHAAILPALDCFYSQGWLQAVVVTEKLNGIHLQIEDLCIQRHIPFYKINHEGLEKVLPVLFDQFKPELVFMCGFSYRIPQQLYSIPPLGFFNIHFSLLPAYRGPDPIFWQLKNGEQIGGITIHQIDTEFDAGITVARQQIPFIGAENWGICDGRYSRAVFNLMVPLINTLNQGGQVLALSPLAEDQSYFPRPTATDLTIDWDRYTAATIENLVNACNPSYGGALTFYKGQPVRIMEVVPIPTEANKSNVPAGSVVFADAQNGVIVKCADQQLLRLNIVKLNEGYFTGFKLFALGVKTGECFDGGSVNQQLVC